MARPRRRQRRRDPAMTFQIEAFSQRSQRAAIPQGVQPMRGGAAVPTRQVSGQIVCWSLRLESVVWSAGVVCYTFMDRECSLSRSIHIDDLV